MEYIKLFTRFSFFLLASLSWMSCIPEPLEVKGIPNPEPEIVVSSQLSPDGSVLVWLTRTFSALEVSKDSKPEEVLQQIAVNDALVIISGPSRTDTLEWLESGLYGGLSLPLEEGVAYELYVNSEKYGEVRSGAKVQEMVRFSEVEAALFTNIYDDTLAEVAFSFRDNPGKNYYLLNVQPVNREDIIKNAINPDTYTMLIEDTSFSGGSYHDIIQLHENRYEPGDTLAVSLSGVSHEYFKFLQLQQDKQLDFISFLSEPFNYPSNIIGGKGFFELSSPDTRLFVFKRVE